MFTFSIKREIRHFHVVVVQKRQRNVQKSTMYARSYCFAYQTFFYVLVAVASLDLKVPIDVLDINCKNWPIIGTQEVVHRNEVLKTVLTGSTYPSLPSAPPPPPLAVFAQLFSKRFPYKIGACNRLITALSTNNFINLIALSRVF